MIPRIQASLGRALEEAAAGLRMAQRLSSLSPDEAERLERLLRAADHTWEDAAAADEWARSPHRGLEDQSPAEAAIGSAEGLQRALKIIGQLEYSLPT